MPPLKWGTYWIDYLKIFLLNFTEDTNNSGNTDGSSESHHTGNLLRLEGGTWRTANRRRQQVSTYLMGQSSGSIAIASTP